jgi:hypothetical protein
MKARVRTGRPTEPAVTTAGVGAKLEVCVTVKAKTAGEEEKPKPNIQKLRYNRAVRKVDAKLEVMFTSKK